MSDASAVERLDPEVTAPEAAKDRIRSLYRMMAVSSALGRLRSEPVFDKLVLYSSEGTSDRRMVQQFDAVDFLADLGAVVDGDPKFDAQAIADEIWATETEETLRALETLHMHFYDITARINRQMGVASADDLEWIRVRTELMDHARKRASGASE